MGRANLICRFLIAAFFASLIFFTQGCGSGSNSGSGGPPPPPPPTVGANVNESLETVTVYVDGTTGNDNNPGTKSSPFQTINKALATAATNNQNSVGTQINVNAGIYREKLAFQTSQTSLPFTLQATTNGTVFVSGADSLPGPWTVSAYGPDVYTSPATSNYIFAACPPPSGWAPIPPILLRREMVFVNGTRLNQVMFSNELRPGTFWADTGSNNPQLYIWPTAGTNMTDADVEVATASRSPLIRTDNVNSFVIRGLTFEYDNSCLQSGSRINNGTNILIDTDQFIWSNSIGFGLYGGPGVTENITVQHTSSNHNGQSGFSGKQVKYVLYQNDESSYNSWRGAQGSFYGSGFDGSDFFLHHNSDFNDFNAYYNVSSGVHFDTDNVTVQVSSMQAGANNVEGLSIEATDGPFTVQNSAFCGNSLVPDGKTANINISDSKGVTLTGNTLYNGAPEQEYILGDGRAGTNWEQPSVPLVLFNQNLTQTSNTFTGNAGQLGFYSFYKDSPSCSVPISSMWQTFGATFSSQNNTWGDTAATNSSFPFFEAAILGGIVPLSTWQAAPVGQDASSQFVPGAKVPQQCAVPKPDMPDFWLVPGPRGGAGAVVPKAGGPAIQIPISLVSVGFTGNVSLTLDTTQPDGSPVTGVSGSFSPQSISLSPGDPLTPLPSTLSVTTTSGTPDGFYPLTITATDGQSMTRTAAFFLQVGSPSALEFEQFGGSSTVQTGTCGIFQIHSVDSNGNPSDVLSSTFLNASGLGSGKFYQDERCSTPVSFTPINAGCSAGIEIPQGDYSPHFSGALSIWFMDPKSENLNITISDEATNGLQSVTTPIQVQ